MRIFYAADHEPFPGNKLWHNNLYLPLVDLGHEVIPFDYDLTPHVLHADLRNSEHQAFIEQHRPQLEQALLQQIEAAHREQPIDLFFSYFYSALCRPDVIRAIKDLGIVTVNWFCNASYQFYLIEELAPAYDFSLVPEKFRLDDYRRVGANPIYCQEAANPNIYKPYNLPHQWEVTFVGQMYGTRPHYIKTLLDAGVDTYVWGPGWQAAMQPRPRWRQLAKQLKNRLAQKPDSPTIPLERCGPALSDEELIQMYSRSKISLGFSTVADISSPHSRIKQVRLRDFEATMSGAFYMVEYFEELAEFFEPDKEIVFFNDAEELIEKARFYLKHETERERIRQAGLHRARTEHTWHNRFNMVFEHIGLQSYRTTARS